MTIVNFMNQRFERIIDTQQAIRLLRKFETLNLPNMGIQDKYLRILNHYAKDIDYVSRTYQKNKTDPPVARDLPPIAGKLNLSSATIEIEWFQRISSSDKSIRWLARAQ